MFAQRPKSGVAALATLTKGRDQPQNRDHQKQIAIFIDPTLKPAFNFVAPTARSTPKTGYFRDRRSSFKRKGISSMVASIAATHTHELTVASSLNLHLFERELNASFSLAL